MKENKKEQTKEQDRFAGFKRYYANGQVVIDLTSIDYEPDPLYIRGMDIERQQIYGSNSGNSNLM